MNGLTPLTPREREIAELVAQAHTNREIAEQLEVATNTVSVHVKHIFVKLGIHRRVDLALLVERQNA